MIKRGKNKERDVDNIKEIIKEIGIQKERRQRRWEVVKE